MRQRKACIIILAASAASTMTLPTLAQPREPEPVLVLNSQWNLAYAKGACKSAAIWYKSVGRTVEKSLGCENFDSCPRLLATAKACSTYGPTGPLHDFEQRLTQFLAADPTCRGIHVVRYNGPADTAYERLTRLRDPTDFWTLSLNFAPGAATQPWQLKQRARSVAGDDEPQTIASRACASILGRGGG